MSVASVVIIALVSVTTVLLGGFGIVNYLSERTRQEAKLRHNLVLDAGQFSAALALPVWNFDRAQIDKVIESMMQDQTIYGVVVKLADVKSTVLARTRDKDWRPQALDREFPADGMLVEEREITFGNTTLGSMKLFVTAQFMEAELKDTLLSRFFNILVLDLILTISLYLLLWRGVLKPLRELEAYAQAVSSGKRGNLDFQAGSYQGELESLRASIKKMIGLLDARYAALLKHEVMLLGVLNSVPQSIFWKDRESVYVGCNKVFANAVGLAGTEQVAGKTDFDLCWNREDAEHYRSDDQAVMQAGSPRRHIIERAQLPDGTRLWVDTSKVPLLDGAGKAYGILGVYDDITESKRAEEALGRQLAFDEIIQWQLARFASSTGDELDELVQGSLQEMARFIGVDFAFIAQLSPDSTTWSSTYEWCAPGIPSRRAKYQKVPLDRTLWTVGRLAAGEIIRVERLDDLPVEAAAVRREWEAEGFKAVLQVPLRGQGERVKGTVGLVLTSRESAWLETDIQRLKIVTNAIANVLERHQAESELRRSEARYRTLFEAAQDAIFINSGECFIDCNPHALAMFGCRREEIIGQSPVKFSPAVQPDGQDSSLKAREKIQAALAGEPQHFEWRHCRIDGTEFDAEVNLNRIDLDHQSLMLGIVRDITQRKRAEAAIRESEAKFSTAFRASPDPMTIIEVESGRIVDTNEVFVRFFGWRRQEVIGATTLELGLWADPIDRTRFRAVMRERGSVRHFQAVAKARDGRCYDCLISAEAAEINGLKTMIVVSQDITERKQAEAAVRASEAKFSTAFRASPDPMTIIDVESRRILDINEVFERAFGWQREEAIGKSALELGLWAEEEDRLRFLALIEENPSVKNFAVVIKARDGRCYDCLLSAEIAQINGRNTIIVVAQDVTERKKAERRLERSRQQLRALSARLQSLREEERTHLAREIHDHLGQLLTALKLDLRSIERKIPALGDAALVASLNGKLASARELTDETIKSIQQIASELRPAILDRLGLEAAIDSETQAFQSRTGIQCESLMPAGSSATAPEQATAVFRIFQEILTNIARHAQATRVRVRFSRENGSLVLEVTDDGVGMQNTDLENPKSLGLLGMRERAEILGGRVVFAPGDGKGTTVTMRIPVNGKAES